MNIAILGGSFDPPHLGHILIARQVLEYLPIDEVWLMPVAGHAFDKSLSPAKNRMEMTKMLAEDRIKASDFEIEMHGKSITISTLRKLKSNYPSNIFTFIIGSDQLPDFHKWDEWQSIIKDFGLVIFPREIVQKHLHKYTLELLQFKSLLSSIKLLDSEDLILTNISSSKIRKRVKRGVSINSLVSEKVEHYIKKNKLYE